MDELFGRQMPHSAEAEQAVLGALLIDSQYAAQVISQLRPEEFYLELNRGIYEVICSMFNFAKPIDAVTVLNEMKLQGGFDPQSAQAYLVELMSVTPSPTNVMQYVAIVKDRALLRGIAGVAQEITAAVAEGTGTSEDVLEAAEQKIYALRQGRNIDGLEPVGRILSGVYQNLAELSKNKGGIPGLPTGLGDLDNMIMGLNNSDLIILASRPGMGKTSLGLNIALHVGKKTGKGVAIFSLEMSKQQLAARLLSGEAYVDLKKLHTGLLDRGDWQKLSAATAAISKTQILISDNSTVTVSDIKAQCHGGEQREPHPGRGGDQPHAEDHGQGAERAGALPEPAEPGQHPAYGQTPRAFGPAGIRLPGAGRGYRPGPVPGGLLQPGEHGAQYRRADRSEEPPREHRDHQRPVDPRIYHIYVPGYGAP